jgi:hypothetical protein
MTLESSSMSALNLPPDQRAVLEMVLRHGRGYGEIARVLSVDRAAVRQRALNAVDALSSDRRISGPRRALIIDYLLGQVPPRVSADIRRRLAESASERAFARRVASVLEPLSAEPLPQIPVRLAEPNPAPGSAASRERIERAARWLRERPRAITLDRHDRGLEAGAQRRSTTLRNGYPTLPLAVEAVQASAARSVDSALTRLQSLPSRATSRVSGAMLLGAVGAATITAIVVFVIEVAVVGIR